MNEIMDGLQEAVELFNNIQNQLQGQTRNAVALLACFILAAYEQEANKEINYEDLKHLIKHLKFFIV